MSKCGKVGLYFCPADNLPPKINVTKTNVGARIKVNIALLPLFSYQSQLWVPNFYSNHTQNDPNFNMSVEANTEKPHSHHAIAKDIPEDPGLRNTAAKGVCIA